MSIMLTVDSSQLDSTDLQNLTRELYEAIDDGTNTAPQLATTEGKAGTKAADLITIGSIILEFIDSGSMMALLGILAAYLNRERSLNLKFKNATGLEVEVNAKNIDSPDIQQLLAQLQKNHDE